MDNNIVFFEIFPWNKNFETGIELIDEQHKELVRILNKLATHLANRSNEVILNEIFTELANYADYHFKTEEKIWSAHFKGDEWYGEHEKTHHSFIDEVLALKRNEDKKPLDEVVYEIVSFLSKWLAYHILDTDKRMAKAVHALELGASMQEAKSTANDEMNGSTKVLVDTVLSMYESLSTRTLKLMREQSLRKQAEESLHKSEERWKFILDGGADNVWDWDIENNKHNRSVEGISIFDITGNTLNDSSKAGGVHPDDIDRVQADFKAHFEGKTEFYTNKHRVLRTNGSWSWVLSRGKVVSRDENGRALRMVGTHSDVTERELATLIYKHSSQAMFVVDVNMTIISINSSFSNITGYQEEDIIGKKPSFIKSGRHDDLFYQEMWEGINKGHWSGEIWNRRKDGEIYPERLSINSVLGVNGQIDHYVALFNDLTKAKRHERERKQQEERFLQQSRMAQMGEMISMIAHQWRQPLAAISANSMDLQMKMILETFDSGDTGAYESCQAYFKKNLEQIDVYVQNLSTTINDFKNFYRPNKKIANVLINTPVAKALSIIGASLASNKIKVIENYESDKMILMHENEMMQVLLNILKNAEDNFIERKTFNPTIMINTRDNKGVSIIEVYDNGGGISQDVFGNIFDPYFSTKKDKNGTGLGLYMSKTIVEAHYKGKFYAKNKEDGACFIIELSHEEKGSLEMENRTVALSL